LNLKLLTFNGGRIHTRGVRFLNRSGVEETRDMADPNHCYLVVHPRGTLAWDAGLPDEIASQPEKILDTGHFRFELRRTLASQFAKAGIDPRDVDWLAFSHLQIDHAGNACLFNNARVLVQQAEYKFAFSSEAEKSGYRLSDYTCLAQREVVPLQGDLDVFGDGRVQILSAPGHTPGHQVLFLDLDDPGPLLLSGDLYYAEKDPREGWLPYWNFDREQTFQAMERMEEFAREHKARWLINHSPDSI
jgi:N-acyl homoserine lactone hydrolase